MREDVPAMESGDKGDFKYADDFVLFAQSRSTASCATATRSRWATCF